jgi:hypothetical protein
MFLAVLACLLAGALGQTEVAVTEAPPAGDLALLLKKCLIVVSVNGKQQVEEELSPARDIHGFLITGSPGLVKNLDVKINGDRHFKVGTENEATSHAAIKLVEPVSGSSIYVKQTAKEGTSNVTFLACDPANVTAEILAGLAAGADGSGLDPAILAALGVDPEALSKGLAPALSPTAGKEGAEGLEAALEALNRNRGKDGWTDDDLEEAFRNRRPQIYKKFQTKGDVAQFDKPMTLKLGDVLVVKGMLKNPASRAHTHVLFFAGADQPLHLVQTGYRNPYDLGMDTFWHGQWGTGMRINPPSLAHSGIALNTPFEMRIKIL